MILISQYLVMIKDINNNIVPKRWKLSKFDNTNKCKDMDSWLNQIKTDYDILNKWIFDGFLKVYDLSIFSNEKLFITLLPIYFQKKLPESKSCSSDKIKLTFKLTKYESNQEITEDIINEYKKVNNNQEFIFIKGLRLKGFESHKEGDKEIKLFKENLDNPNGELLPIIAVSYTIQEFKQDNVQKIKNEEESEEEDEEEEIALNQEEKTEKIEEKPQASGGGGPKSHEDEEEKKGKDDENKMNTFESKIEKSKIVEAVRSVKKVVKTTTTVQKMKIRYFKKHCKLEIPFIEQRDENVYNINEPYGYIEIRFDCDKFRQEEYFINKNIVLILDK